MKKLIVLMSMVFCLVGSAMAQKGIQSVGVHLGYGTEIESFALGMKYQRNITDNVRLEPSINYFFENKGVDMFDINFNAHYLFPMASNVRLYPLAGLTFERWDIGKVKNKFGVNIGGGAEFDIANDWMMNFEIKYKIVSDFDQAVFSLGVAYMF